jgi:hypothetical protein
MLLRSMIIISRTDGEAHDGLLGHRGVEDTVSTVRGPCAVFQVCSVQAAAPCDVSH